MFRSAILPVVAGAAIAMGMSSSAAAGTPNAPLPRGAQLATPRFETERPAAAVKHKAQYTITDVGTSVGTTLSAGFTTIDTVKIKCTKASGCTIGLENMVQLISQSVDGNSWAIAVSVDGSYLPNSPYIGQAQTEYFTVGETRNSAAVSQGTHTLQVQVFTSYDATLGDYQIDYTVYEP